MSSSATASGSGSSYLAARKRLDQMGYFQSLTRECIPLVEALLSDLSKYKDLAVKRTGEDRSSGRAGEPRLQEDRESKPDVTVKNVEAERKVLTLERKIRDYECLQRKMVAIVHRLQHESMEKSKKILRLEAFGGTQRAKVMVTKGNKAGLFNPKLEATTLVRPKPMKLTGHQQHGQLNEEHDSQKLDLLNMYENRNEQIQQELEDTKQKLTRAHKTMQKMDEELHGRHMSTGEDSGRREGRTHHSNSHYMLKLIRENEELRRQMTEVEKHSRICVHGKRIWWPDQKDELAQNKVIQSDHRNKYDWGFWPPRQSRSCEDIRAAVEQSHVMMHNQCLKNQVYHLKHALHQPRHHSDDVASCPRIRQIRSASNLVASSEISSLKEQLAALAADNRTINRRLADLNAVRLRQRDRIEELERREKLKGVGANVRGVITDIERQRDTYKNAVEALLGRIDPGHQLLEESLTKVDAASENARSKSDDEEMIPKTKVTADNDLKILREIQNQSRKIIIEKETETGPDGGRRFNSPGQRAYRPSPYRQQQTDSEGDGGFRFVSTSSSRASVEGENARSHHERPVQLLSAQMAELREDNDREIKKLSQEIRELKGENERLRNELEVWKIKSQKTAQQRPHLDEDVAALRESLRHQQLEADRLLEESTARLRHLESANDELTLLRTQLAQKTVQLSEAEHRVKIAEDRITEAGVGEERLRDCLHEIANLKESLGKTKEEVTNLKEKLSAERTAAVDVRKENARLSENLRANDARSAELESEISELRRHVQQYVKEVKRVEELLNKKETERTELLEQYRQLSIEVDSAEAFGRRMEAQADSLKLELAERSADLEASHRRLAQLERDLIDLSLTNETYRGRVARLVAELDVTGAQLRRVEATGSQILDREEGVTGDGNGDGVGAHVGDLRKDVIYAGNVEGLHGLAATLDMQKVELQRKISDQNQEIESLNREIRLLRDEVGRLSQQVREEREKHGQAESPQDRNGQEAVRRTEGLWRTENPGR